MLAGFEDDYASGSDLEHYDGHEEEREIWREREECLW
jgi:hypothetical protein